MIAEVLASNVTGPNSLNGSKMREIRDKILCLIGALRGGKWLLDEYLNIGNPKQCLAFFLGVLVEG